jgi:hypothetical protein
LNFFTAEDAEVASKEVERLKQGKLLSFLQFLICFKSGFVK